MSVLMGVVKNEGFLTLYNGLSAGLLRQATYTTTRLGTIFIFWYSANPRKLCLLKMTLTWRYAQVSTHTYLRSSPTPTAAHRVFWPRPALEWRLERRELSWAHRQRSPSSEWHQTEICQVNGLLHKQQFFHKFVARLVLQWRTLLVIFTSGLSYFS